MCIRDRSTRGDLTIFAVGTFDFHLSPKADEKWDDDESEEGHGQWICVKRRLFDYLWLAKFLENRKISVSFMNGGRFETIAY